MVSETGDDSHLAVGFWHPCIFVFVVTYNCKSFIAICPLPLEF